VSRLAAPEVRFSGRCPHVVGFSLAVAKLSVAAADANATSGKHAMTRKEEHLRSYGPWAIRRCDVYVCSFSPGLIDLRLDIVKDLWQAGLKADLVRPPLSSSCPSPTSALPDSELLAADVRRRLPHAHARAARQRVPPRGHPVARHRQAERGRSVGRRRVGHVPQGQERSARCRGGRCVPFSPTAFREEVRARRAGRAVADSVADSSLPLPVPRSELSTWLIKEMREQTIVDEAVGGGSNDAVTASTSRSSPMTTCGRRAATTSAP